MSRLEGRVAVVTAAGSGMGLACARRFAADGAHVVVADLDDEAARAGAESIRADGGRAVHHQVDVADVGALRSMFEFVEREFGVLHVLHNHAGLPGPPGLDVAEEVFDRTLDVNLRSAFYATSLAVPLLRRAPSQASVIFTSSVSGLVGAPSSPLYGMTKGGVVILMRSLAKQLGPEGIRVNAICPGPIDTPMLRVFVDPHRQGLGGADADAQLQARRETIPLRRLGRPEDVASAAAFLASDEAAFITGVSLPVDGGLCA